VNILVTMGGARYDPVTAQAMQDYLRFGADVFHVYDDAWIEAHPFRKLHSWLWDHPGDKNGKRGFGWYAWKPMIILDELQSLDHMVDLAVDEYDGGVGDDVVLYLDGDSRPVSSMAPIFDIARRDGAMLFSSIGHKQRTWCKADCYAVMGQEPVEAPAGCARFAAFRVGDFKARSFLWEWYTYSVNPTATTFDASKLVPELPDLSEHRTEQAIMSNLAHRYGYKLWRECDDSGEGWDVDRDVMPVAIFQQSRLGGGNVPGGSRFRNVGMP
jgi:hypothetical protein